MPCTVTGKGGEEVAHCEQRGSAQHGKGEELQKPRPALEGSAELTALESRGLHLPEGFVAQLLAAVAETGASGGG